MWEWQAAKLGLILLAAAAVGPIAIKIDIARFKRWHWFHPRDLYPSALISIALLFGLVWIGETWLFPRPWTALIMLVWCLSWAESAKKKLR